MKEPFPKKQDFLDNLDDANYNPFATKTKVVDDINNESSKKGDSTIEELTPNKIDGQTKNDETPFATPESKKEVRTNTPSGSKDVDNKENNKIPSIEQQKIIDHVQIGPKEKPMAIVKPHQEKNIESQLCNITQSTEIDKLPTTGSIDKNTVDLMPCKAIDSLVGESMPDAEEDIIVPPAKGYNLDFLDQLDDPNFNPFETKTAIKDNFGTTDVESLPQGETAAELIEKPEEKKKEVKKKPMGKKVSKPAVKKIVKDDKESTNEDGSKSEQSESPKQPTKRDVPKPWLKKKKANRQIIIHKTQHRKLRLSNTLHTQLKTAIL